MRSPVNNNAHNFQTLRGISKLRGIIKLLHNMKLQSTDHRMPDHVVFYAV